MIYSNYCMEESFQIPVLTCTQFIEDLSMNCVYDILFSVKEENCLLLYSEIFDSYEKVTK